MTDKPELHLWTDEEVAKMKAQGVTVNEPIPASKPGICVYCGNPTEDDTVICSECIPF